MARNEGEGSAFILGLKTGDFPLCPLPTRKLKGSGTKEAPQNIVFNDTFRTTVELS